jgi:1-aminocyclopropane-1-carboxylate deaminase/D-cysteine desulfhydrase-like pyridoxal-dependent ACC family enzyme
MSYEIESILQEWNILLPLKREIGVTPIEYHQKLSQDLDIQLFIKREDRIDDIGSGNKLRKLSYILPDALHKGATVLVTVGSVPSNQCKAVANIAHQNNLRAHVVYGGNKQSRPNVAYGNYFLTSLFEPTISWYEFSPWENIENNILEVIQKEIKMGENPYIVPSGASLWPGIMGSIELGLEIGAQLNVMNLDKVDIVLPAGSGGTCLGLHIAAEHLQLPWKVHGICIGEGSTTLHKKILEMKNDVKKRIFNLKSGLNELYLHDVAIGRGYDVPTKEELNEMQFAIKNYNLILDPNYMLKAYIGLKSLLKSGVLRKYTAVLLVHTGGQVGIFDNNSFLKEWHKNKFIKWLKN